MIVGVGVGGAGPLARQLVNAGLKAIIDDRWMRILAVSHIRHSAPVGGVTKARFANAAALFDTPLHPEALLGRLLSIERRLGRVRTEKNAARALDLDMLWTSGLPRRSARLTLPHPQLRARPFALEPLQECFRRAKLPLPQDLAPSPAE